MIELHAVFIINMSKSDDTDNGYLIFDDIKVFVISLLLFKIMSRFVSG